MAVTTQWVRHHWISGGLLSKTNSIAGEWPLYHIVISARMQFPHGIQVGRNQWGNNTWQIMRNTDSIFSRIERASTVYSTPFTCKLLNNLESLVPQLHLPWFSSALDLPLSRIRPTSYRVTEASWNMHALLHVMLQIKYAYMYWKFFEVRFWMFECRYYIMQLISISSVPQYMSQPIVDDCARLCRTFNNSSCFECAWWYTSVLGNVRNRAWALNTDWIWPIFTIYYSSSAAKYT